MRIILTILTLIMLTVPVYAEPAIIADSAILVEATTGRVIWEKNADDVRPPASMTKMLTCILGLENLSSRTSVSISPTVVTTEDNTFSWTPMDKIDAFNLLEGMMLVSDNGGAVAVAQAVSGTIPRFSMLMNEKAEELGCTNTHFSNPNGLPNSNHYSTARDMARIAVYCMKNPDFREIVSTKKDLIKWTQPADKWTEVENTNDLLITYNGANGIKTGWTNAAGGCLAASAHRGNVELIAIVMHSPNTSTRFDDAAKILDYGFSQVKMTRGINKDRVEKIVFVRGGQKAVLHVGAQDDLQFPLLNGESMKQLKVTYDLPKIINGGVKEGAIIGDAILKYNGQPVATVPMVARESINAGFSVSSTVVSIMIPVLTAAVDFFAMFA